MIIIPQNTTPHQIKGRGAVFWATGRDNPGTDVTKLTGKQIEVDGVAYVVTATELSDKNGRLQDHAGLVVRPA